MRSLKKSYIKPCPQMVICVIVSVVSKSSFFFSDEDPKGNVVMFFSSLSSLCFYLYQLISDIPKETRRMLQLRGLHVTMMADITKVRILYILKD